MKTYGAKRPIESARNIDSMLQEPKQRKHGNLLDFVRVIAKESPSRAAQEQKDSTKKEAEQLFLDLGQKNFHYTTCAECGMAYQPQDQTDYRLHKKFHSKHRGLALAE